MDLTLRKARREDARFIARMADAATGGEAARGWAAQAGPEGDPFVVGATVGPRAGMAGRPT